MVIAVDFDGTIVEHEYPKIGREIPFAFDVLKRLQKEEFHQLILWTVREGELLEEALEYCRQRGLEFYAVNSDHPGTPYPDELISRKLKVDIFIDDRNIGGLPDWGVIYRMIKYKQSWPEAMNSAETEYIRKKKPNLLIRLGEMLEASKR
jgi:hypothetical protein